MSTQTWVEVSPEAYELLPPKPSRANGRPCIRVTMLDPGIICAFSRQVPPASPPCLGSCASQPHPAPAVWPALGASPLQGVPFEQRLRCFAFLPQRINPLETEHVSIYIAPELPDVSAATSRFSTHSNDAEPLAMW